MAFHTVADRHHRLPAHSRGRVGAVRALVGLTLAFAAVAGVGAAATSATWGDAQYLGPSSWQVDQGPITP